MPKRLYFVTETETWDGEKESHTRLSDVEESEKHEHWELSSVEAKYEDITVEMICDAVAMEMEGANRHSMTGIASWIAMCVEKATKDDEDVTKSILYQMVLDKGLLWDEF